MSTLQQLTMLPSESHATTDKRRDAFGLSALLLGFVSSMWGVPDWPHRHLLDPSYLATAGYVLVVLTIIALRATGQRGTLLERITVLTFLLSMPLVYLADVLLSHTRGVWVPIELAGVLVFSIAGWLGWTRSSWFLAAGIFAHGIVWDMSHHNQVNFVPSWYTLGCLIADVGMACYVATQVPAYERAAATPSN